jgi:mono/diheme cytochrome c family protein
MIGWLMAVSLWPRSPQPAPPPKPAPAPSVTVGARLYVRACLSCHGPHGDGQALVLLPDGRAAPPLNRLGQAANPEQLSAIISRGQNAMPGWSGVMTPHEIQSLVLYVRSLNAPRAPAAGGSKPVAAVSVPVPVVHAVPKAP